VLGPGLFARLYRVHPEDVLFTVYDAALALKATLLRLVRAGDMRRRCLRRSASRPATQVDSPI